MKDFISLSVKLEALLTKSRHSFSNQEIKTLKDCISILEELDENQDNHDDTFQGERLIKLANLLLKFFSNELVQDFLKNNF